jgi:hypothetical protein
MALTLNLNRHEGVRAAPADLDDDVVAAFHFLPAFLRAPSLPTLPMGARGSVVRGAEGWLNQKWRRGWDSNPRLSFPNTRFPSVLLKPLGHLSLAGSCIRLA